MEKPVCGTCGNGSEMITYTNNCILKHIKCANPNSAIEWSCSGKCPCPPPVSARWQPHTTPAFTWPTFTYQPIPAITWKPKFKPVTHRSRPPFGPGPSRVWPLT